MVLIIIDQTAIGQDLSLGVGHGAQADPELYQAAVGLDGNGRHLIGGFQQGLADAGQVDIVAVVQHVGGVQQEGQHAPVDAVGCLLYTSPSPRDS